MCALARGLILPVLGAFVKWGFEMFIERSGFWLDALVFFRGIGIVIVVEVFQDVAWLAFEDFAYGVERGKADGLDLAGLYARHVHVGDADFIRKVVERHLAISHDAIQLEKNSHGEA